MFPEFRDLITQLKTSDRHFLRSFDQHNELDQKIKNMEASISPGTHEEIETLKKEKLHLKDQIYTIEERRLIRCAVPVARIGLVRATVRGAPVRSVRPCRWRVCGRGIMPASSRFSIRAKISKRENGFFMKSSAPIRLA